jgi:hypothetical protein
MGGRGDIRLVLGERADAGNTKEVFQFLEEAVLVLLDKRIGGTGHVRG